MNVAAKMYSFQMLIKVRIHTVIIGGTEIGNIMFMYTRNTPAPSMMADSSISCGTDFIKPLRINTEIGVENAIYGKIIDKCVFRICIFLKISINGNSVACIGIIIPIRKTSITA
ncbi:hypothetical protein D3C77_626430 [compost metagenome]